MKVENRFLALAIVCMLVVAYLIFSIRFVRAHDDPTDWIGVERRTNAIGQACCGRGDCFPFRVDQIQVKPDGYHFPDGEIVPFGKAAPSIDHFYWKCAWAGETKCVFAPLGAS